MFKIISKRPDQHVPGTGTFPAQNAPGAVGRQGRCPRHLTGGHPVLDVLGTSPRLPVRAEQLRERLGQLSLFHRAVPGDEQLGEEALVELSPDVGWGLGVALVAVPGHGQRRLQGCGGGHAATPTAPCHPLAGRLARRREQTVVIVVLDEAQAHRDLVGATLVCSGCHGRLTPRGFARARALRRQLRSAARPDRPDLAADHHDRGRLLAPLPIPRRQREHVDVTKTTQPPPCPTTRPHPPCQPTPGRFCRTAHLGAYEFLIDKMLSMRRRLRW